MIEVKECVICGGATANGRSGIVAPFVARRIAGRNAFPVRLDRCTQCGFEFYNPRLEAEDEKRLYAAYRSPEYQRQRHETEPWYTEQFNASLSADASWQARKDWLEPVLRQALAGREIRSVLDFGGDDGRLVALLYPNAERFVYDISGVAPAAGVTALRSEAECRQHRFDLIVTSNLLEHVGFPLEIMKQISAISTPGTLLFHEVPLEASSGGMTLLKRLAQFGILAVTRPKVAASLLPSGGVRTMHEHVNYFSAKALDEMMRRAGWNVLSHGAYRMGNKSWSPQMVWALGERGA